MLLATADAEKEDEDEEAQIIGREHEVEDILDDRIEAGEKQAAACACAACATAAALPAATASLGPCTTALAAAASRRRLVSPPPPLAAASSAAGCLTGPLWSRCAVPGQVEGRAGRVRGRLHLGTRRQPREPSRNLLGPFS